MAVDFVGAAAVDFVAAGDAGAGGGVAAVHEHSGAGRLASALRVFVRTSSFALLASISPPSASVRVPTSWRSFESLATATGIDFRSTTSPSSFENPACDLGLLLGHGLRRDVGVLGVLRDHRALLTERGRELRGDLARLLLLGRGQLIDERTDILFGRLDRREVLALLREHVLLVRRAQREMAELQGLERALARALVRVERDVTDAGRREHHEHAADEDEVAERVRAIALHARTKSNPRSSPTACAARRASSRIRWRYPAPATTTAAMTIAVRTGWRAKMCWVTWAWRVSTWASVAGTPLIKHWPPTYSTGLRGAHPAIAIAISASRWSNL